MNSIEKINLSNLKNCNQYWDEMPEHGEGRLCHLCNNILIDFRKMTDKKIAESHAFSNEKICGIYKKEQLLVRKKPITKPTTRKWKAVYLGILGMLFAENVQGQEAVDTLKTVQTEATLNAHNDTFADERENNTIQKSDSIVITGRILDEDSAPVPFVSIHIKNTTIGTSSDFEGYYRIHVTDQFDSASQLTLVYKLMGIAKKETIINKSDAGRPINVIMDEGSDLAVFYVTVKKRPLHKRIWFVMKRPFVKK
ncbi:carboxypeptidase-like regulatory domain-containing protein [bacterium]|nr:carboxypeptidase-like regulatory domain-containing protein [bacterium]